MSHSFYHFADLFQRNMANQRFSKNIILLYTEEYETIAQSIFAILAKTLSIKIKKLNSIFDKDLEKNLLKKDIFILFYSMPWRNIKNYLQYVRPVLTKHIKRSYIIRDCYQDFNEIYQMPYNEIRKLHSELIQLGNQTQRVMIKNNLGTELEFTFTKKTPWREIDGSNLANEVLPSEISNYTPVVNGRLVFKGSIISLLPISIKYGYIKDIINMEIENGYIKKLSSNNLALENDLAKIYSHCHGNKEIVELGIGSNLGVKLRGMNAPFEERKAGFHLGTGGYQAKSQHIDYVLEDSEIYFDDVCVFANNQFKIA